MVAKTPTPGSPSAEGSSPSVARPLCLQDLLNSPALDCLPAFIVALDRQARVTYINPKGCQTLGRTRPEILGLNWFEHFVVDHARLALIELYRGAMQGEIPFQDFVEYGLTAPATNTHLMGWRHVALRDSQGTLSGCLVLGEDISVQRRVESELQDTEEMFRQVLDAIHDLVLVKGPGSRVIWANKAFRDCYGMTNAQLRGIIDSPIVETEITRRYMRDDAWVFSTGKVLDIRREPVTRHDGKILYFHTVKSPIFNAEGKVVKSVGVSRDITEKERLENQVRQADKSAALSQLAAGIAQELLTPLSEMLDIAESTRAHLPANAPDVSALEAIIRSSRRCRNLVNDLLRFSQKNRPELREEAIDDVLASVIPALETQARTQHVQLVTEIKPPFPKLDIDRAQIRQVVMALATNGFEAMPQGGTLTIATHMTARHFVIAVGDTGTGIAPELQPRVFDPFLTTKPAGSHTGLGLTLAYEMIKNHRGEIDFVSSEKGTTFSIRIPLRESANQLP